MTLQKKPKLFSYDMKNTFSKWDPNTDLECTLERLSKHYNANKAPGLSYILKSLGEKCIRLHFHLLYICIHVYYMHLYLWRGWEKETSEWAGWAELATVQDRSLRRRHEQACQSSQSFTDWSKLDNHLYYPYTPFLCLILPFICMFPKTN